MMRDDGKPQDGPVSRYINRPISRRITRVLLKLPITPTTWTLTIFVLLLVGAVMLTRGDYWGFLIGTILYQIHSILDGCDGEIARSKNLQSERGQRLDNWCDHAGNFLMALCLGIGLCRGEEASNVWGRFYLIEGCLTAFLLMVNEALLVALARDVQSTPHPLDEALYPRHREMMQKSGILFLGEKVNWWLVQITKRDVALFAFLVLALIGQAQWILHLLAAFALISLTLASSARIRRARR